MRSKKAFMQSLIHLMYSMPLDKITITELCKHSGYSRNAFYNVFCSKDDLVDYTVATFLAALDRELVPMKQQSLSDQVMNSIYILKKHSRLLKLFLKDNKIKGFREKTFYIFYNSLLTGHLLEQKWHVDNDTEKAFAATYVTSSISSIFFTWIQESIDISPENVLQAIIDIKNPANHGLLLGVEPFKYTIFYKTSTFKDVRVLRTENAFYEYKDTVNIIHTPGLFNIFYKEFYNHLAKEYASKEFHAEYITSSIFCVASSWFSSYPHLTPLQVATIYKKLLQSDIYINITPAYAH